MLWQVLQTRADLVSHRRLGAALGHRISRRCAQRLRAGAGLGGRRRDHAVRAPHRSPSRSTRTGRPGSTACTCSASTGLLGIAITGDAFNAFVFLEISSLVDLRADRARPRPAGAAGRVPVPDHGHDRRDLLRHRRRPALSADRQPQHGRHRGAARSGCTDTDRPRSSPRSPSSPSASA